MTLVTKLACSPVLVQDDLMYHTIHLLEVITRESCLAREPCSADLFAIQALH